MAYTDTPNMPLHMPTPGTKEPAQIALLNENCVVLANHDHTTGKALAVGRMRSGLAASRPAAGQAGNVYFSTDTGIFNVDTGTAWVQFLTSGGQATVTGWTLVDPIIRDTLQFGPEGSGTIDASITRTGAGALRVDTNLGVGVAPGVWGAGVAAARVGEGALMGVPGTAQVQLLNNSRYDGTNTVALTGTNPGHRLRMDGSGVLIETAPAVAAGAAQTFTTRAAISQAGTLTLTPGSGAALSIRNPNVGAWLDIGRSGVEATVGIDAQSGVFFADSAIGDLCIRLSDTSKSIRLGTGTGTAKARFAGTGTLTLTPDAGQIGLQFSDNGTAHISTLSAGLRMHSANGVVGPYADNVASSGAPGFRWGSVYAVNGTINTSSAEMKQAITPLDPAACYEAAKTVRWYDFRYQPPTYTAPEPPPDIAYDASDSNEVKAEKKALRDEAEATAREAYAKMLVETAPARHQRGFVFAPTGAAKDDLGETIPPVPDLFGLDDRQSTTPQADLATLGCAMQEIIRRLEALEGQSGSATAA